MEELFKEVARTIALGAEAAAVLIIGYGAIEAFVLILKRFNRRWESGTRKEAWLRLGMWLLLAKVLAKCASMSARDIALTTCATA